MIAAAFGTAVGNPLTFPFMFAATYEVGSIILSLFTNHVPNEQAMEQRSEVLMNEGLFSMGFERLWPLLKTMSIGAIPLGFLGDSPARALANVHTGFNVLLALIFLPLTYVAASILERMMPDAPSIEPTVSRVRHLDEDALARPAVALGAATREVMRLADTVQLMLQESISTFADGDERRREEIARLDDEVDRLQEEIKLYLTRLTRQPLSEEDSRRCFDLILFTTNLEHAGDIIDKGIPTTGLLAQVLVAKYQDHLPLYRQEHIFGRAGLAIPRSTLAGWVGQCGVQLQPLVDALKAVMLKSAVLHADETPVAMLKPGNKKTHRAYIWTYCTTPYDTLQAVVFDFAEGRGG
jgi:hypothetical protein